MYVRNETGSSYSGMTFIDAGVLLNGETVGQVGGNEFLVFRFSNKIP